MYVCTYTHQLERFLLNQYFSSFFYECFVFKKMLLVFKISLKNEYIYVYMYVAYVYSVTIHTYILLRTIHILYMIS